VCDVRRVRILRADTSKDLGVADEVNTSQIDYGQRYHVVVPSQSCMGFFEKCFLIAALPIMNLPRGSNA
jgi:hypothetical protein